MADRYASTAVLATVLVLLAGALHGHERSQEDAARDANSRPLQVLGFLDVQPGWTVLDMFAGGGYYTEVLADVVGEDGKVYAHNNAAYLGFAQGLDARVKDGRLPNVERYAREVEDIDLRSGSVDMVLMVMTYHDAYFSSEGWTVTADPLFKVVHRVLKPGGVLGVIDHAAARGSGTAAAQQLHRIDPDFAKSDIEGRGFELVAESNLLKNPNDDGSKNVFDQSVRGRTSKFLYKFVKN